MQDSRTTTALFDQVNAIDSEQSTVSAGALFDNVDRDGNGNISKSEFLKMYDTVKSVVSKEHATEKAMDDKLVQSKRRNKALCATVTMLVPIIAILLAGNAAMAFVVQQVTKDVKTTPSADATSPASQGSVLTTPFGGEVSTARTIREVSNITTLPSYGPRFNYMSISYLQIPEQGGVVSAYAIQAYKWYNSTDLDLFLTMDKTLHITATGLFVSRTSTGIDRRRLCAGLCTLGVTILAGILVDEYSRWRDGQQ